MYKVFSSLRARVLLLIAIPFAVMLGLTVYHTLGECEEHLANAKAQVLATARVMAGEQQRIIEHVHQVLASEALLPEVRRGVASEECNRALAARHQQEPNLDTILLALPDGGVICNAIPAQPINIADREYFKAAIRTRGFSAGGYVISRTTGSTGFGFGYPVLDATGIPKTVLATTLSLDWLKQELAKAQLPEGSRVVVVDGEGLVLGRYPDPEAWVGKSATELPLLRSILAKGGEGTEEEIGLDGLRRIFGFVPLHRTASGQAYLWVAIPKEVVVGSAQRENVASLLIELALLVLTFGAVWLGSESLFIRRIAALMGAAKELGQGNLATRVGTKVTSDEIGQLAQSFDQMAERVQTSVTDLSRALRALRVQSAGNRAMLREREDEQRLLEEMCRAVGEAGGYHLAWAGYAENNAEKTIRPVAHWGSVPEGYLANVRLTWNESETAPPSRAIRTGMPVVTQDIPREPGPGSWRNYALRCGCGSCVALPLRIADEVIGVLNICSKETDAFNEEEVRLLSEAAADLSFGIARQRAEVEAARLKAALASAEERIAAAAEASLDALFILKSARDTTGHIVDFEFTDINAHAEEMLGMAREKLIGQRLCELLPFYRTGGFFDKYLQVVATGTPLEEEFPIDTPELQAKWLRQQVVRVDDGIAISSRDITTWKAAGTLLRESEEKYRTIFEESFDGLFITSPEGKILDMNKKGVAMFGYDTKEEMQHLDLARDVYAHAPDRQRILSMVNAQGKAEYEVEVKKKNGETMMTHCSLTVVRDENGAITAYRGIIRDITARKRAEEALRESEETLRTIASAAQDAVLMLDNEGSVAFWNSAAETMFGYSAQEAMGKELHALLAPARFHEAYRNGFNRFKETGEGPVIGKTIELAALRKDGAEFPMELSLSAVKLRGKWSAVGIVRDITERKRAADAIEKSEKRFHQTLDEMMEGCMFIGFDWTYLYVNDAAARHGHQKRENLIGRTMLEMYPGVEQSEIFAGYRRVMEQRVPQRFEASFNFPDGSMGWYQFSVEPAPDGIFVLSLDITERKRNEEALRESQARLELALQSASMGVWHWDIVENRRHFDAQVCRLLGIDAATFTGAAEEFVAAVHPDDRETLRAALARTVELDVLYEPEYRAVWPDGSTHYITARGKLVRDDKGRPLRVNGIIWDITARKQDEFALKRANRALHTLSACNDALVRAEKETELLDSICRLIVETGGFRMAWVGFPEQDLAKTVRPLAHYGHEDGYLAEPGFSWADTELGRSPTGKAIRTGAVRVNRSFLADPALAPWREAALKRGYQSSIALPLKSSSGILGVLTIYAAEPDAFNEDEVRLLQELADDLAFGIETLRTRAERDRNAYEHLHHEEILRQSLEDSITAIANTVEMRDPYTAGHQRRVGEVAVAISRELGLPEETIHGIQLASSIHDLGKIRVPAEILSKPGKLTGTELMLVQAHPQAGYDILKDIKFPWPITTMVLQHHERLDGSGYPQGLKGDQIELGSRIIAVADVVEAMASHRPYRPGLGIDAALAEIRKGRGTAFDPAVVDACLKLFREGRFVFQG